MAESSEDHVIMRALADELHRSLSLQLEDLEQPYFIQYTVSETTQHRLSAAYGALVSSTVSRSRTLNSQVRVGSPELDNSNFAGRGDFGTRGLSSSTELPIDDDYLALRNAVWSATDSLYKSGVATLSQKRAYLRERSVPDRPADFTQVDHPTVESREGPEFSFDRRAWEDYLRSISQQFEACAQIQNGDVELSADAVTRYLVNSEGSRIRYETSGILLRITAEAQAADGQRLSDSLDYYVRLPEQLPELSAVQQDVKELTDRLAATAAAPILDEYTGPVLVEGLAAAQLFRQLLAQGVAAQPDPVGLPRRSSADDLASRVGRRILPVTFHIYDDPRQEKFEDKILAGNYLFDDEGLPPQRFEVVVDGKLEGLVSSRAPTRQSAKSNGHGRRSGGSTVSASIGSLFVEASKGESAEDLKQELMDAADDEGLEFGLRISSLQNRSTLGGFAGRFGRGATGGGRLVGDPIAIYKVYVKDGREEPVRGCEFAELSVRSLRRIVAAGAKQTVHNVVGSGSAPASVIAPAVLFEELDLSRIEQESEAKPILTAPHAR